MIIRGPRLERDFTILGNAMLRNRKLSWKARGMLAFILSQPPGYKARIEDLVQECEKPGRGSNREAMRTGMKELQDAGYVVRTKERRDDGTFVWNSVVYDMPIAAQASEESSTDGSADVVPPALLSIPTDRLSVGGKPDVNRSTGSSEGLTPPQAERKVVAPQIQAEADRILGCEIARGKRIANPAAYRAAIVRNLLDTSGPQPSNPRESEISRARALGRNRAALDEPTETIVEDLRSVYADAELADAAVSAFLAARRTSADVG